MNEVHSVDPLARCVIICFLHSNSFHWRNDCGCLPERRCALSTDFCCPLLDRQPQYVLATGHLSSPIGLFLCITVPPMAQFDPQRCFDFMREKSKAVFSNKLEMEELNLLYIGFHRGYILLKGTGRQKNAYTLEEKVIQNLLVPQRTLNIGRNFLPHKRKNNSSIKMYFLYEKKSYF